MAMMKKAVVKGLKETKGIRNKENNTTADNARKANAVALAKKAASKTPKRPVGELPKRMSGFAKVVYEGYPELGKSGAAARAGKIRGEFNAANKKAAAKKAALAKKAK